MNKAFIERVNLVMKETGVTLRTAQIAVANRGQFGLDDITLATRSLQYDGDIHQVLEVERANRNTTRQ